MNISVNGSPAYIKSGSSFEMIYENMFFMGRDNYTLTLTFPLKDCPENRQIFGHIDRVDVALGITKFDCSISDRGFFVSGTLLVSSISESEVQCQFVSGRCENVADDPWEKTYINALDIGSQPRVSPLDIAPSDAWLGIDDDHDQVALPWINKNYPDACNNWVKYEDNRYAWDEEVLSPLSWQPFLIVVARRICDAVGYSYDFSEWDSSVYRHLLVCNTLPGNWDLDYKHVLPEWTVTEFFENLEMLMSCRFEIDHRLKKISFSFNSTIIASTPQVKLDDVEDDFSGDISNDEDTSQCEYLGVKRLAYTDAGHEMQPYYACDWFIDGKTPVTFDNVNEMIQHFQPEEFIDGNGIPSIRYGEYVAGGGYRGQTDNGFGDLLYCRDEDTYFVFRLIGTKNKGRRLGSIMPINYWAPIYVLQPVNQFGSGSKEKEGDDSIEIDIVPVCLTDTYVDAENDRGYMMHLVFSDNSESAYDSEGTRHDDIDDNEDWLNPGKYAKQIGSASLIEQGEPSKSGSFYDKIYVAFWTGVVPSNGRTPYPPVDRVCVPQDWSPVYIPGPSIRLYEDGAVPILPKIDPSKKYKFRWVSNRIPDPIAVFNIRGRCFVCEKITATFTEDGMSQLLKGEFFAITD